MCLAFHNNSTISFSVRAASRVPRRPERLDRSRGSRPRPSRRRCLLAHGRPIRQPVRHVFVQRGRHTHARCILCVHGLLRLLACPEASRTSVEKRGKPRSLTL